MVRDLGLVLSARSGVQLVHVLQEFLSVGRWIGLEPSLEFGHLEELIETSLACGTAN